MQMRGFVKSLPTMPKGFFLWFLLDALRNFSVSKCRFTCREQRCAQVIITITKEVTDQNSKRFLTSGKKTKACGITPCKRLSEESEGGQGLFKGTEKL